VRGILFKMTGTTPGQTREEKRRIDRSGLWKGLTLLTLVGSLATAGYFGLKSRGLSKENTDLRESLVIRRANVLCDTLAEEFYVIKNPTMGRTDTAYVTVEGRRIGDYFQRAR